jgi:hypothetical protein
MSKSPEHLYLDLIKKTLAFTLWEDPGIPIGTFDFASSLPKRLVTRAVVQWLRRFNLQLVRPVRNDPAGRDAGKLWRIGYADTMIGLRRLDNIQFCVEQILRDRVPGDLIEAGVWRGGAAIFMRAILAAFGVTDRTVFVADSFQGLPPPNSAMYPQDRSADWHQVTFLAVSQETVQANFSKYGLLDDQVVFLKGWFKDTLPNAPIRRLAVLRIDADMYESTTDVLIHLYPKVSVGGFCIIDDYAIPNCQHAVDDFRARMKIDSPLEQIDSTGVFWRKNEAG